MKKIAASLYFLFAYVATAFAQNAQEQPPTAYTEPASALGVVVFLVVFFGSIALFLFWIWYRSRNQKEGE